MADSEEPACSRCGGKKLRKLISRIARIRSKEVALEDLARPDKPDELLENPDKEGPDIDDR